MAAPIKSRVDHPQWRFRTMLALRTHINLPTDTIAETDSDDGTTCPFGRQRHRSARIDKMAHVVWFTVYILLGATQEGCLLVNGCGFGVKWPVVDEILGSVLKVMKRKLKSGRSIDLETT
ncbi:hypothetical protein Bbelb_180820 [Branchiostoma belcheri]|nr:hypothetical protein Bbelb_180820 [Branchiostoma belcheri]